MDAKEEKKEEELIENNEDLTPRRYNSLKNLEPRKKRIPDLEQIRRFAHAGLTHYQMALCLRVSSAQLSRWKEDEIWGPQVRDALKRGDADANSRVKQSLYRRAIGYFKEWEKVEEKLDKEGVVHRLRSHGVEEIIPDSIACMMWLSNRDPDNWKNRIDSSIMQSLRVIPAELSATDKAGRQALIEKMERIRQKQDGTPAIATVKAEEST